MAIVTQVIDDLSGKDLPADTAATTITVDGTDYDVHLGEDSKARLIAWLSGEGALVPARAASATSTGTRTRAASKTETYGYSAKEVREWARASKHKVDGKQVSSAGRLTQKWFDDYKAYKDGEAA